MDGVTLFVTNIAGDFYNQIKHHHEEGGLMRNIKGQ
jgi:hypothetical protein